MRSVLLVISLCLLSVVFAEALPNRITGELEAGRLVREETWTGGSFTWLRFTGFGGFTVNVAGADRPYGTELQGGAGIFYRLTDAVILSYRAALADPGVYVPRHRHLPGLEYIVSKTTSIGVSADLAFYNAGDLILGTAFLQQRMGATGARLSLKGGTDPAGESILSGMLVLQHGREQDMRYKLGGAYGNETPDGIITVDTPTVHVAALFGGISVPFKDRGGVHATVTGEWRDGAYFRSVVAVAPYISF